MHVCKYLYIKNNISHLWLSSSSWVSTRSGFMVQKLNNELIWNSPLVEAKSSSCYCGSCKVNVERKWKKKPKNIYWRSLNAVQLKCASSQATVRTNRETSRALICLRPWQSSLSICRFLSFILKNKTVKVTLDVFSVYQPCLSSNPIHTD